MPSYEIHLLIQSRHGAPGIFLRNDLHPATVRTSGLSRSTKEKVQLLRPKKHRRWPRNPDARKLGSPERQAKGRDESPRATSSMRRVQHWVHPPPREGSMRVPPVGPWCHQHHLNITVKTETKVLRTSHQDDSWDYAATKPIKDPFCLDWITQVDTPCFQEF